jgi:hypothetical protein
MRQIKKLEELDIKDTSAEFNSLITYNFRNSNVPIGEEERITVEEFNTQSEVIGLKDLIWAEGAQEGVFVYVKNDIGISDNLRIADVMEFILDNPEALWDQYKTLVLVPLGYIKLSTDI